MKRIYVFFYSMLFLGVWSTHCSFKEDSAHFKGNYSENYVMRWAFQELCDYSFDPRVGRYLWPTSSNGVTFDPEKVQGGELIFVRNVELFFKTIYSKIEHPFVMITAGEYRDKVKKEHLACLDDTKIIAWFSVHPCSSTHPKFHAIPLGLVQDKKYYHQRKVLTHRFARLRKAPKTQMLYMNFGDLKGKKPERADVHERFKSARYCYAVQKRLPFLEYMEEMANFKFTLSPPGYGPDCYRTWEALLVGSIPIVKRSHMDSLFEGLPVLLIDDWDQITESFLERSYKRLSRKRHYIQPLFIEYWAQKIKYVRDSFMATQRKEQS